MCKCEGRFLCFHTFSQLCKVSLLRLVTQQCICNSGWTIRPMFDQSSVSWYNRARSLTTSRNRLHLALLYVSQYPCIFSYFKKFFKLSFNISIDFSRLLCLFMSTAIFTGSECFS